MIKKTLKLNANLIVNINFWTIIFKKLKESRFKIYIFFFSIHCSFFSNPLQASLDPSRIVINVSIVKAKSN